MAKKKRGGRNMLKGSARTIVPIAGGAVLTLGTTLGLRAYLRPEPGTTSEKLYRWAPAIGAGVGLVGAGMVYFLAGGKKAGMEPAWSAALVAALVGGGMLASERLNASKPGASLALGQGGGAALPAGEGAAGLRALMPEYAPTHDGLGAIVMQPLSGAYGESVNVAGLGAAQYNHGAFGTRPF